MVTLDAVTNAWTIAKTRAERPRAVMMLGMPTVATVNVPANRDDRHEPGTSDLGSKPIGRS